MEISEIYYKCFSKVRMGLIDSPDKIDEYIKGKVSNHLRDLKKKKTFLFLFTLFSIAKSCKTQSFSRL